MKILLIIFIIFNILGNHVNCVDGGDVSDSSSVPAILAALDQIGGGDDKTADQKAAKEKKLFNQFYVTRLREPRIISICHAVKQQWGKDKPTEAHFKRVCNNAYVRMLQDPEEKKLFLKTLQSQNAILDKKLELAKATNEGGDAIAARELWTRQLKEENNKLQAKLLEPRTKDGITTRQLMGVDDGPEGIKDDDDDSLSGRLKKVKSDYDGGVRSEVWGKKQLEETYKLTEYGPQKEHLDYLLKSSKIDDAVERELTKLRSLHSEHNRIEKEELARIQRQYDHLKNKLVLLKTSVHAPEASLTIRAAPHGGGWSEPKG